MATRTAKKKAVAKRQGSTDLATIKEQIAAEASSVNDSLGAASGNKIRTTLSKEFVMPDGARGRDPLRLVIVDFSSQNHYYEEEYEEGNPKPPSCFSLSKPASLNGRITGLSPSDNVTDRMDLDEDGNGVGCDACPMNQFGSDSRGRGKACKNIRRLVVVPEGADDGALLL